MRSCHADAYKRLKYALTHPKYKFDNIKDVKKVSGDVAMVLLDHPIQDGRIDSNVVAPLQSKAKMLLSHPICAGVSNPIFSDQIYSHCASGVYFRYEL